VVDDGSRKNAIPRGIVKGFQGFLPGIRLIVHQKNRGAPVARNMGAKKATGEYLFFLDADCELYPDALEVFVETLLQNPDAAYAYCGFKWGGETVKPKFFDADALKLRNFVSTMSMIRRLLFEGFDESLKRHQDWDLFLTMLLKHGREGICTGRLLFETTQRESSISTEGNIPMMESVGIVRRKHGLA